MSNDDSLFSGADAGATAVLHARTDGSADLLSSLVERFDRLLDMSLSQAHSKAFELAVDGEDSAMSQAQPIRAAVYRSLRHLRLNEAALRRRFVSTLRNEMSTSLGRYATVMPVGDTASARLALMSDTDLEDAVLCASLAIPSEGVIGARLHALAIGLRHAGFAIDAPDLLSRFGARPVLETYLCVLSGYQPEPELKIAMLKAVEGHFLRGLVDVFGQLHRLAHPASADAHERASEANRASAAPGRAAKAPSQSRAVQPSPGAIDPSMLAGVDDMGSKVVASVLHLLAGRARAQGRATAASNAWTLEQVVEALGDAQAEVLFKPAHTGFKVDGDLSEQLGRFLDSCIGSPERKQLSEAHVAVADLVQLVFDFVIAGEGLDPDLRRQLLALKIPYLRVALVDRHLFVSKTHVARRLLEELSILANRVGRQVKEHPHEHEAAVNAVKGILSSFDGDIEQLRGVLDAIVGDRDRMQARHRVKEERVLRTAEGKERLRMAWRTAQADIDEARLERRPAQVVQQFLERPWAQYLVLMDLRGQRGTPAWNDAMHAARSLATLTDRDGKRASSEGRSRLGAPAILGIVRKGLALVGYSELDVLQLWRCITRAIVARSDEPESARPVSEVLALGQTLASAHAELKLDDLGGGPPAPGDAARHGTQGDVVKVDGAGVDRAGTGAIEPADALPIGTWVDIHQDGAAVQRAKLCWRGVASKQHIFVNRSGEKVLQLSQGELAERLRAGSLVRRDSEACVDGAMASIFARLGGTVANVS